jgi:hypothetical protein
MRSVENAYKTLEFIIGIDTTKLPFRLVVEDDN